MFDKILAEVRSLTKAVLLVGLIPISVGSLALRPGPAAAEYSTPFRVIFDRMEVIEDGDPVGAGEIYLPLMVIHQGPDCPEQICSVWDFAKTFEANKGDTVPLNLQSSLIELKDNHTFTVYAGVADRDPLGLKYPAAALTISEHGPGNARGAYSKVIEQKPIGKAKTKLRLYYNVVSYRPDLKLTDFRTVPYVPNPGYADTTLCIEVVNVGHDASDRFHAQVFVDDVASAYSLPVMDGLPASGPASRKEACGRIPTPPAGRYRMRVELEPVRFDASLENNTVEKEMQATRRMTYQEAWRRTRQQVGAFSREVEELRAALGLTAASREGRPPRVLPATFAGGTEMPPNAWGPGSASRAAQAVVVQFVPRLEKRPGRPSRPPGGTMPRQRGPLQREPSRRLQRDQQEILQMVSGLRSRCVRIQGEGRHLRHAYREVEKNGSAEATSKLIDKARYFYELGGHLDRAVREHEVSATKAYVGALRDGGKAMKQQLNALRKFGG